MSKTNRERRLFVWPKEAEELVKAHLHSATKAHVHSKNASASLATRLAALSGYPRDACLRFIHRHGITQKRSWRTWTKPEQQRLFDLIETHTIQEAAQILQRTASSIRLMLHRLGESSQRGRDWLTPYSLADALHIRSDEVMRWIHNGWLKCRTIEINGLKKRIIDPDDFSQFVRHHGRTVVGRRLRTEGLQFVQNFVFPPKHAHLLPLRPTHDASDSSPNEEDITTPLEPTG